MNLATGSLMLLGLVLAILGLVSKLIGTSILAPLITNYFSYLIAANTCLLLALVIDKFQKD